MSFEVNYEEDLLPNIWGQSKNYFKIFTLTPNAPRFFYSIIKLHMIYKLRISDG